MSDLTTQDLINKCSDAIDIARLRLRFKRGNQFIASLGFRTKVEYDTSMDTPIKVSLPNVLTVNPAKYLEYDEEAQIYLFARASWHIALRHSLRNDPMMFTDQGKAQRAMAEEVNNIMDKTGLTIPDGVDFNVNYDYEWEAIYPKLPDSSNDDPNGGGDGIGQVDSGGTPESEMSDEQQAQQQQHTRELDQLLQMAAMEAEQNDGASSIPGHVQDRLAAISDPVIPWQRQLNKYVDAYIKTKYSFKKMNRRAPKGFILPKRHGKGLKGISVYEDLSGSITEAQHNRQVSEITSIRKRFEVANITYVGWTHEIETVQHFGTNQTFEPDWNFSGGTNIYPVLDHIRDEGNTINIIFTDGYFDKSRMPEHDPDKDIIWVILDNPNWEAPYGDVLHVRREEI